jgi:glycosyltransferase involved in cell wall biosynthesis
MKVLVWHVHGSWTTSFVSGGHEYLLPVTPGRDAYGLGRARTWHWPPSAREVPAERLREEEIDVVLLQRPHEADLVREWAGRVAGRDVPAAYLEHNAPTGHAVRTEHPVARDERLAGMPLVHVTHFNAMAWDCGPRETMLVEHGIPDPGYRYTGADPSVAVVVNEPIRRWRVAGTDVVLDFAREVGTHVYGMGTEPLGALAEQRGLPGLGPDRCHDLPQQELHERLATHRVYLHPYRWTSLGLALVEAMTLGMPVLALAATETPEAVPPAAGVVTNDLCRLRATAARWLNDPGEARAYGERARAHALDRYGLGRFLADWDRVLKEVTR